MNAGLDCSNLHYEVYLKPKNFYADLLKRLRCTDGAIVIYRSNYRAVESLALKLQQDGVSVAAYHSGLGIEQRNLIRTQFWNNQVQVLVTTGSSSDYIHKPDIRLVVHHELPPSIYRYSKETSKAGRDGQPARCILFVSYQDVRSSLRATERRFDLSPRERKEFYTDLKQVSDYVVSSHCRLLLLSNQPRSRCGRCDNCCASFSEAHDWTVDAQKFLSCVARFARLGRTFGTSYTIEVLQGSTDERIFRYRHHELSTYGIGKDKSAEDWRTLAQFLLFQNLVEEVQIEDFSVLKLNDRSWEIMRGQRSVLINSRTWRAGSTQPLKPKRGRSYTLELYQQGLSVTDIAQAQGYQEETILHHLAKLILDGETIDIMLFVSRHEYLEILRVLKTIGTKPLKPVYENLGGRYGYGQIDLVLAHWQRFGGLTQVINDASEDRSYDKDDNSEENPYNDLYDIYEHDTSMDLGYLEDMVNPNAY